MAICVITPKCLKIIYLDVNLNNNYIMLKSAEGFNADEDKNLWPDLRKFTFHAHNSNAHFSPSNYSWTH